MEQRPLLAVTMGDAAGVGPETIVRAWADPRVHRHCRPLVVGHPEMLRRAVALVADPIGAAQVKEVSRAGDGPFSPDAISVLPVGNDDILAVAPGDVDARTGQAAYESVVTAIKMALAGQVAGIVTAPLSKAALHSAGHPYPGHTELLAEKCGSRDFAMMLYLPAEEVRHCPAGLGVVHVTLHVALRDVFASLRPAAVLTKIRLADAAMRDGFALSAPRIGVCALNPHGGEGGLFGTEESQIIAPAIEQARDAGIDASGPSPADTLMIRARDGEFDAVVAMYHDQGHIPLKLLGMHRAVNVTLGLPIVRTSVAHGTAFDRAWQGTAEAGGMVAAMLTAARLSRQSRPRELDEVRKQS